MPARLALAMSSSFFTPSFAFSSHLDPDGAPPSELSWSSSLAVVAVSCSGLFTVIVLMLACLCCKKGGIGFKEFENAEGDERVADLSAQGSPAAAHGPDVYVLPLTEVSLPMAKQPGRSVQLLKSADLGRHSLLYLKEIGHGWFGKVFLGEVNSGASGTQVVVKELKSSASVQEQMQFLEEAQPYRTVQHSNLLQCLAQCAEVTPYLLVMESCPLGDLKGYLRSCRATESVVPDALTLQRMACEVACGTLHLHRHSFVHSDLALRNCLLTADLGVKVGDYGLAHCRYREDYFVTTDRLWVPLRWIAPELVDEVHGNLLVADQTKAGNVWSLGVTLWELFELGLQPYPQHSDRQVLAYAVREQQLKLPKPQLQLPLSDRWYEVMQLCWLQPDQRPTAEEVHLLLSYLCAKGATEAEEEFELRWRYLRPRGGVGSSIAGCSAAELAAASSFPLLEQFSGDGFHGDGGDDVLTVTETSHGLNFEYKWEAGPGEAFPQPGDLPSAGPAARLQELSALDSAPRGVGVGVGVGVVPVLSARSPSLGSEYFIRLEEAAPAGHAPDCAGCAPSARDDDSRSAALARATEPLLGQAPPSDGLWGHSDCHPTRRPRSPPPPMLAEQGAEGAHLGEAAFCPPMEDPLGASPLGSSGGRLSPAEEELGEAESGRAAQHPHWSSNASANNNSGSRHPESWDPHYFRNYDCPRPMQAPGISPESSHLLAPEDPGAPLGGLQVASPAQEPGGCLDLPLGCPTQVLAPAACLVTPPWTQAALSGGDESQAEPRLAAEAEHPTGPQLPIPSALSPAQEGAPLPSAEAGAPDILPASPMPAAGSRAGATGPAQTPDGGGCSPEPEGSSSEDRDTTQATSRVFTDLSGDNPQAEGLGAGPAFRALQEQVRTPDCLDSLDIPSTASDGGSEVFSPSADCTSAGQPRALDSGYDTENYESPEFVLKDTHEPCEPEGCGELASEGESPGPETRPCVSLGGLSEKNPYRDSAYFSDLDAEVELPAAPGTCAGGRASGPELQPQSLQSRGPQSVQAGLGHEAPGEAWGAGPQELLLALLPPEASTPTQRAGPASPRPEPPRARDPAEMPPAPGPGPSHFSLLTPVALSSEGDHSGLQEAPGLSSEPAPQEQSGGPGTARDPVCLTLPGLPTALVGRPEGEGEDSEDSEESDEELRCYSVQEPSEGSEEEAPVVPVVVESQRARSLRGLLKVPSLLSQAFCADLERKKKAVSFFDDVTVYLFDQESPTRELGEPFPGAKESPPTFLAGSPGSPSALSRPRRAASSPSSSVGEEGGGFEWDDDFPLMPAKAAFATVLDPASPSLATAPKPAAPFSRFTVSPTPASRFSVTHVSDSDAELAGGSASPRSVCEEV